MNNTKSPPPQTVEVRAAIGRRLRELRILRRLERLLRDADAMGVSLRVASSVNDPTESREVSQ